MLTGVAVLMNLEQLHFVTSVYVMMQVHAISNVDSVASGFAVQTPHRHT